MDKKEYKLEEKLNEGKTKQIWKVRSDTVLIISKDRITAGDGAKSHEMKGKAAISTKTNCNVFNILQQAGIKTAFIKQVDDVSFLAKRCEMIPIEWVTRRLATGSYLRRHPGTTEGYKFCPPLQETFYKDDENHDPQWSDGQILSAQLKIHGHVIGNYEVDVIKRTSLCVFEILEKVWATKGCVLVDMKVEFGFDSEGNILLADVIDSDSWRLWPSGDKRLMKDKQVYRNLTQVTDQDIVTVKNNFEWVAEQLENIPVLLKPTVVIIMGSNRDEEHCQKIMNSCISYNLNCELRVVSAHKTPDATLKVIAEYEGSGKDVVFIAVAGRSNGLGPTIAGNTTFPVINCPPSSTDISRSIWSSLELPSGIGCSTVMYPEAAALMAAHIHSLSNYNVWMRLRVLQMNSFISLRKSDKVFNVMNSVNQTA